MTKKGWFRESARHSLASRGLRTPHKSSSSLESLKNKSLWRASSPGKFEGNFNDDFAKALHEVTMEGFADDEIGDVESTGWFGLISGLDEYNIRDENGKKIFGAIVNEDSNGFFTYNAYTNEKELMREWKALCADVSSELDIGE